MKNKLYASKWTLLFKKLKYWLFTARPIPLLVRKKCKSCKIVWNPELFRGCPLCGRGPNRVWVLIHENAIKAVFHDPDDAKWAKSHIESESDSKVTIEDWDIQ